MKSLHILRIRLIFFSNMNRSILITGVTGFLGSHLARYFLNKSYSIIGLKRQMSDTWRCKDFEDKIEFCDIDGLDWKAKILIKTPKIIIHAAWDGVTSESRNDMTKQVKNINIVSDLLQIGNECRVDKFICIGSQAEYGYLDKIVTEESALNPNNAYGITKVVASKLVEKYSNLYGLNWYWLRLFSMFGEYESEDWLISSVITQLIANAETLTFTSCEQKYAYLYIHDLLEMLYILITKEHAPIPGIYNISGDVALPLRTIIETIVQLTERRNVVLRFGALPQRQNQSTHIQGSMDKYFENVGLFAHTNIRVALEKMIRFNTNRSVK